MDDKSAITKYKIVKWLKKVVKCYLLKMCTFKALPKFIINQLNRSFTCTFPMKLMYVIGID